MFEQIQDIIAEELDKDKDQITRESTFEEMDADSLDVFQIINDIEEAFDIEIDVESDLKTVGDLVDYVENLK